MDRGAGPVRPLPLALMPVAIEGPTASPAFFSWGERETDAGRSLVVGLLRCSRPRSVAQGSQAHGGLRRAHAVFGISLLDDPARGTVPALGINRTAGRGG